MKLGQSPGRRSRRRELELVPLTFSEEQVEQERLLSRWLSQTREKILRSLGVPKAFISKETDA
jgi:hypothetical protein